MGQKRIGDFFRQMKQYLLVLTICLGSESILAAGAAPGESLEAFVARQLIVLFQLDNSGNYLNSAVAIVNAANNPSANAQLHARLGNPVAAIRLLEGLTSPQMQSELAAKPLSARARLERYIVLTYPTAASATAAKNRLEKDSQVLSVGQNFLMSYSAVPADRYFSINPAAPAPGNYQWGMQALKLPQAWDKVRGNAYIGAADTGIFTDCSGSQCNGHPDLQQNFRLQFSRNLADDGYEVTNVQDRKTHGTHVAGIMAATPELGVFSNHNSNTGVAGVCWTCSYSVMRIRADPAIFPLAITYAADHGLQVLNMSFGDQQQDVTRRFQSCADGVFDAACTAIEYAKSRDVVLVAAAGNWRENRVAFPARSANVIAVGGVKYDSLGPVYWNDGHDSGCLGDGIGEECGSNYGPELAVMAPAKSIVSTVIPREKPDGQVYESINFPCGDAYGPDLDLSTGQTDGYGDCTGTSMSAPHIAGLVGLIRSANPLLTREQVKNILVNSSQPCVGIYSERCNGAGVPDAGKAITAALGGPNVVNRLTPLFGFYTIYNNAVADHFYTTVPQMALAALSTGMLLPQPQGGSISYSPIGSPVPGYPQFPTPPCGSDFSPCLSYPEPRAIASVFVTHVNPIVGGPELVPLYRYSWACSPAPCHHVSHVYIVAPVFKTAV